MSSSNNVSNNNSNIIHSYDPSKGCNQKIQKVINVVFRTAIPMIAILSGLYASWAAYQMGSALAIAGTKGLVTAVSLYGSGEILCVHVPEALSKFKENHNYGFLAMAVVQISFAILLPYAVIPSVLQETPTIMAVVKNSVKASLPVFFGTTALGGCVGLVSAAIYDKPKAS